VTAKKTTTTRAKAKTKAPEKTAAQKAQEAQQKARAERLKRWRAWSSSPEAIEELCEFIGSGGVEAHLAAFCRERNFAYATVILWLDADMGRRSQYELARQARADNIADKAVDVALTPPERTMQGSVDGGAVADKRLLIDTLKWSAAKLHPKRYSDKLAVGGADDLPPMQTQVSGGLTISPSEAYRKLIGG
jgi:hypothetical protein